VILVGFFTANDAVL